MSIGLERSGTRLTEGFRGFDPGDALMQLLAIQLRGFQDSTYLFLGVGSGVLNGAPKFAGGVEVGRTPGLIPEDLSKAEPRLLKFARFGLTGLIDPVHTPVFGAGLLKGLYDELSGYAALIGALNWDLIEMLMAVAEDVRTQDGLAFRLGEQVGASFLGKVLATAEGDDYRAFVFELGVLLGPFIIDIIGLIISGGAGPLFKRAAAMAASLPGRGLALAKDLQRRAGDRIAETGRILDQLLEAPPMGPMQPATAGGVPWTGPLAGRGDVPSGAFLSETGGGARGVDDVSRGLGTAGAGSRGRSAPSTKSAAPEPGFSPAGAASAGAAHGGVTGAAGRAGRGVLARSTQEATEAARKEMMRAQATPTVVAQWPRIVEPSRAEAPLGPEPPLASLVRPDFEPAYGTFIKELLSGRAKVDDEIADLLPILRRQHEYHGTGTITKIDAFVEPHILEIDNFGGFAESSKAIRAHVGAIVRPGANRARPSGLVRFNRDELFSRQRLQIRAVLKSRQLWDELDRLGLLDEETAAFLRLFEEGSANVLSPYHAGHLFGPGMGAEAFAGLFMIPDFVNVRLQAGFLTNARLGRARASDLRLAHPDLPDAVAFWRRDRAGIEGIVIDHARVADEAKRLNNMVAIESFATTWGDELLEIPFFQIAKAMRYDLKPQHFTRQVDYHVFTLGYEASAISAWGAPLTEVAPRLKLRLLISPPPHQSARVLAIGRYGGELGDEAPVDFNRAGIIGDEGW